MVPTLPFSRTTLTGRWGLVLLVAAAAIVLPARLESRQAATEGREPLFPILTAGRWGFIDRTGRVVVAPRYDELFSHETLVPPVLVLLRSARTFDELVPVRLGRQWGFVARRGELVIPATFESVGEFSDEGLAPAKLKGKYGFIDRAGRVAINPQFDYAGSFACGLARVKTKRGRKAGLIDTSGRFVVAPEFDDVSDPCSMALAFSRRSRSPLTVSLYRPEVYDRDLIAVKTGDRMGYVNRQGKVVIEPAFVPVLWPSVAFREGLKAVRMKPGDKDGYIDRTGRFAIPPQFDKAEDFLGGGLASVQVGRKYGVIDRTGAFIIELSVETRQPPFYGDAALAPFRMSGKSGYMDRKGKVVILPQFDGAARFSEGLAMVMKEGKAGFIDESGAVVIEPRFDAARSFVEGRAAACLTGRWGFIDRGGRFVIEAGFEDANDFHEGLALVTAGTRASYINRDGRVVYSSEVPGLASIQKRPCGAAGVVR